MNNYLKEITLDEVISAIEENGLPKLQESYTKKDLMGEKVIAACALGQAGINLNVVPASLDIQLSAKYPKLRELIVSLNDDTDLSLKEIGYAVRNKYSKLFLKRKIRVNIW